MRKCPKVSSWSAESSKTKFICTDFYCFSYSILRHIYHLYVNFNFRGPGTSRLDDKITVWTQMFCSGWLHHWLRLKEYSSLLGWLLSMIPESLFLKKWNSRCFQTDHRIGADYDQGKGSQTREAKFTSEIPLFLFGLQIWGHNVILYTVSDFTRSV